MYIVVLYINNVQVGNMCYRKREGLEEKWAILVKEYVFSWKGCGSAVKGQACVQLLRKGVKSKCVKLKTLQVRRENTRLEREAVSEINGFQIVP